MRISKFILGLSFVVLFCSTIKAQEEDSLRVDKREVVAIKNNLVYDAIMTPNLELEIRLTPKWSVEVGAGFNPFPLDDTKFPKWRHLRRGVWTRSG